MFMRGKSKKRGLRRGFNLLGIPVVAIGLLAVGQVDISPLRYPATTGELQIEASPAAGGLQRSEPFQVTTTAVGLLFSGGSGDAAIRVSDDGVHWGEWTPMHVEEHTPDAGTGEGDGRVGTEAIFTGGADWFQIQYSDSSDPTVAFVDTTGASLGLLDRMQSQLARLEWSTDDRVLAAPDQPEILPRSSWGGDDCVGEDVEYATNTRAEVLFVHHTLHSANSNAYTADQVPELLYAICAFHVSGRGWHDIGYNTLIDSAGRIWEGRGGGIDEPVRGAHAAGFNSTSVGVAFIGDHALAPPSQIAQDAFVEYAAWRLDVAHVDPYSSPVVVSRDSPTVPDGVAIPLRAISGHRDVGTTSCPGNVGYNLINSLTDRVAQVAGPHIYGGWPSVDPVPGNEVEGYEPTRFTFETTIDSSWRFELFDPEGNLIISEDGAGTSGVIDWAPDTGFEWGRYTASVVATPSDGSTPPRPANFPFTLGDYSPPFFDDEDSPLEWAIDEVHTLGITSGCDDLRFCPLDAVQRWQMALFLTRAWESSDRRLPDPESLFVDVTEYPESTVDAIGQLAKLGITTGVSDTEFAPQLAVPRWQMALFLARFLESVGFRPDVITEPGFVDLTEYDGEVRDAVALLYSASVTIGTSESTFEPATPVSREQMAAFLARALATLSITEDPAS